MDEPGVASLDTIKPWGFERLLCRWTIRRLPLKKLLHELDTIGFQAHSWQYSVQFLTCYELNRRNAHGKQVCLLVQCEHNAAHGPHVRFLVPRHSNKSKGQLLVWQANRLVIVRRFFGVRRDALGCHIGAYNTRDALVQHLGNADVRNLHVETTRDVGDYEDILRQEC